MEYPQDSTHDDDEPPKQSSGDEVGGTAKVFPSILNLVNNILGAGLFSMPWCLRLVECVTAMLCCVVLEGVSWDV